MATTTDYNVLPCPKGYSQNSDLTKCVKNKNIVFNTLTFQDLAASYAVANDPNQVRRLLVSEGLVTDIATANSLTPLQLKNLLLNVYTNSGPTAYGALLSKFVPNRNANNFTTNTILLTSVNNDLRKVLPISATPSIQSTGGDIVTTIWNSFVKSSSTNNTPVITQSTSTSPVVVAYVIGAIAIVGILAYVVLKK